MANVALSNRERKELRKVTPKAPRVMRGEAVVRVAPPAVKEIEPEDRDGLAWLVRKGRIVRDQALAAKWWRERARDAGEVALRSCLDWNEGHGSGGGGGLPEVAVVSMSTAKRELFEARWVVLRGQPDMHTVMDGVCAAGHTLRALAGGDKHRARDLEVILKCALDLIAAWLKEPKSGA